MKKLFISLVITILLTNNINAQKAKWQFTSLNSFGMLAGANQSVFTMQSFNGFSKNLWVHGLGFAFDNYGSNSSPIFLGTKKYLTNTKKIFVFADAGVNIPWRTSSFPKTNANSTSGYDLYVKPYAEIGVGITTPINKEAKFFTQLGYSYKGFGYTSRNEWLWVGPAPTQTQDVEYNFEYRRIALRLGVVF